MNPYNPGLERIASERIRQRMRDAEHSRLVALAKPANDRGHLFERAGSAYFGLRARVARAFRRPRLA
ncbi:MAG TPA: hypothetical protein VFZ80_08525 [Acidimicrobiia bacterium]